MAKEISRRKQTENSFESVSANEKIVNRTLGSRPENEQSGQAGDPRVFKLGKSLGLSNEEIINSIT